MKNPKDLTHDALVEIVEHVRDTLYFNPGNSAYDFQAGLDPDNDFEGDMLDGIAGILSRHDLTPSVFTPTEEKEGGGR